MQEQFVGEVEVTRLGERRELHARGEEAGLDGRSRTSGRARRSRIWTERAVLGQEFALRDVTRSHGQVSTRGPRRGPVRRGERWLPGSAAGHAEPGQILVSAAVQELAIGKSFGFADRGRITLKGFDDPIRLYEVETIS